MGKTKDWLMDLQERKETQQREDYLLKELNFNEYLDYLLITQKGCNNGKNY
jgi:hypothetical protein